MHLDLYNERGETRQEKKKGAEKSNGEEVSLW